MGIVNLSRRQIFETGVLAGGGLILGMVLPRVGPAGAAGAAEGGATAFRPNAFVRIAGDGTVTVVVNHSEMGQGVYTGLPMIVAEELDADWAKVVPVPAPVDPVYNHAVYGIQMTGGSTSTHSEWTRLRQAGAAAREMLVRAAAARWKVDPAACSTEKGEVVHRATGRRAGYGSLVAAAAKLAPPKEPKLKDPKSFVLVGRPTKRLDTAAKLDGKAVFGLDVTVPGMLTAVLARPPVFGGKARRFEAAKALAVPGVKHVVEIPRGVAVVAEGFWAAKLGRDRLTVEWDEGPLATLDSTAQGAQYSALAAEPGLVARRDGDAAGALAGATKTLEAVYELPYLAHASMEPLNCLADVRADRAEVWVGTQFQTGDRAAAAAEAGLPLDKVTLHTTLLGGGFGRRAVMDSHFVREAVQLSKKLAVPVKVVWTREDDTRGGYYRPRAYHRLRGALDREGAPLAWEQRIVCQSIMAGTPWETKGGVEDQATEGAHDMHYAIPNLQVEWAKAPGGIPVLWLRSVGHSHTAFAVEGFLDELAHAAGRDPLEFRLALLGSHPRKRRLLERVAKEAGWGTPLPRGRGRGIAIHESFGSLVAQVAEVSVEDGRPRVHRVVCAIDCGQVVNPAQVAAQMESCIVYGLSATFHGEITFAKGRVKQRNFHDYPVVRMPESPEIEVHVMESDAPMGGVGEPGLPPVAPAVANALFAATGKRLRRLPIRPDDLGNG